MEWIDHLYAIGYAIVFSLVVTGIWSVVIKRGLGTKIEKSIDHGFDKKLQEFIHEKNKEIEEFKVKLNQNQQDLEAEREADKKLYKKFLNLLPSDGAILFIRNHDFEASFDRSEIEPLITFQRYWNKAEYKFLDTDLEEKNFLLFKKVLYLNEFIFRHTSECENNPQRSWIPLEVRSQNREKFKEIAIDIKKLAFEVALAHYEFVIVARQKLKITI